MQSLTLDAVEKKKQRGSAWSRYSLRTRALLSFALVMLVASIGRNIYDEVTARLKAGQMRADNARRSEQLHQAKHSYRETLDSIERQTRSLPKVDRAHLFLLDPAGMIEFPLSVDKQSLHASKELVVDDAVVDELAQIWRSRPYEVFGSAELPEPLYGILMYDGATLVLTGAIAGRPDGIWLKAGPSTPWRVTFEDQDDALWHWFQQHLPPEPHLHAELMVDRAKAALVARELEKADEELSLADNLAPGRADVAVLEARLLLLRKQTAEAIVAYTKALKKTGPDYRLYFDRGVLHAAENRTQEAIDDFTEATTALGSSTVSILPHVDSSEIHYRRGRIFLEMGQFAKAIEDFDEATDKIPWNASARYFEDRAKALRALGLNVRASQDDQKAQSIRTIGERPRTDFDDVYP